MNRCIATILVQAGLVLTCLGFHGAAAAAEPQKPNVLFIAIDDLNHWVGYLGRNPQTITPHIDGLAARGVWFTQSYCAAPVCNPSRAALDVGSPPLSHRCLREQQ